MTRVRTVLHRVAAARQRVAALPAVVRLVFVVALLNGAGWALLTPPFQVPDETAHFAYVQSIGETGSRPGEAGLPEFSTEQARVMDALRTTAIIGRVLEKPPLSAAADAAADDAIETAADEAPRDDGGGPSTASGQPALYYVLAAIPYKLTSWASLPTRMTAVRLLGALWMAAAAALVALLALEFLPGRTWAALVAGCAVALNPVVGFISAGVTPDPLLMVISTAVLLAVVRAFRVGLTTRSALVIGGLFGAGIVTKLAFLAFVPPGAVVLAVLAWRSRDRPQDGGADGTLAALRGTARAAAPLVAGAVVLPLLYVVWSALQGLPVRALGTATSVLPVDQQKSGNLREELSYIWQLYLPRVPGQLDQFGFGPLTETWLKGFTGRYGWLDYAAPDWMIDTARTLVRVGLVLAVVTVVRFRDRVRAHGLQLAALAAFTVSLLVVIGHEGYGYRNSTGLVFEQVRYVFPVIGVYALGVVAACAAAGRRFAPLLAAATVGLFMVHDLSGVLLTLARYQG